MIVNKRLTAAVRIAADFILGVAVFAFVAGWVVQGHGPALADANLYGQADAGPWLTTAAFAHGPNGIGWHPLTRDAAILLLAMSFGVITAFNLAIVRHLKAIVGLAVLAGTPPSILPYTHINA